MHIAELLDSCGHPEATENRLRYCGLGLLVFRMHFIRYLLTWWNGGDNSGAHTHSDLGFSAAQ